MLKINAPTGCRPRKGISTMPDSQNNPDDIVFDRPASLAINDARAVTLRTLLTQLDPARTWRTALDAGCGVGHFARRLHDWGYRVVGFDGREGNIIEARKRVPSAVFHCFDVEDPHVRQLEAFDLVLCFGLLYHLENPFAAVRNLAAMTRHALILETIIAPGDGPTAALVDEFRGQDQGLRHLALIPTQLTFTKMLYRSGFAHVYQVRDLPDHDDFRASPTEHQKRTMLVALRQSVNQPGLITLADHRERWSNLWEK